MFLVKVEYQLIKSLARMGINQLWRPALLNASRSLRQNVVQGRIWGFGSTVTEEEEEPSYVPSSKHMSLPAAMEPLKFDFDDMPEPTSAHSEAEADEWVKRGTMSFGRARSGKVKGLVAGFERSASSSSSVEDEDDVGTSLTHPRTNSTGYDMSDESPSLENDVPLHYALPSLDEAAMYERRPLPLARIPTSGSEGGDEDEDEDDESEPVKADHTGPSTPPRFHPEEVVPEEVKDLASPPVAPPQTPTVSYTAAGKFETTPVVDEDGRITAHNTPSTTIVLTANSRRRKNLSYIAELSFDVADANGGAVAAEDEQTISELLANIEPSGANAWLDQDENNSGISTTQARRSTAKKVFESVRSISRKSNPYASAHGSLSAGASPMKGSWAGTGSRASTGGRASLMGLFEPMVPGTQESQTPVHVKTMSEVGTTTDDEPDDNDVDDETKRAEAEAEAERREKLLEHFRTRLEEVETRLEEMEVQDAEREAELRRQREERIANGESMTSSMASSSNVPSTQIKVDEDVFSSPHPSRPDDIALVTKTLKKGLKPPTEADLDREEWVDPPLVGLPSYVLLVGLGVCSVVMRVVFKRVVGTRVY